MITYKIERELAELSTGKNSAKRLAIVSWNGNTPKLDIRNWLTDAAEPTPRKGITLTKSEAQTLVTALNDYLKAVQ